MPLSRDDTKNEWLLDLATRSLGDIGGSSSIGQERSEAPDVRQWRNNLEEGSGGREERTQFAVNLALFAGKEKRREKS